jgi:hypothetical protein
VSGKASKRNRQQMRRHVSAVLHAFILELRRIFKRAAPEQYRRFPNQRRPCHSCAFNPATDSWVGADATANNLRLALEQDEPFYCHQNMPIRNGCYDPTGVELEFCAGWLVILGEPDTKDAFLRAVHLVLPPETKPRDERCNA